MLERRTLVGVLAGGGVLAAVMLLLAGAAIAFGMVSRDLTGRLDLRSWLVLEIIAGIIASALAGALCRRIARRAMGPVLLAALVLGIGLLEAAELLRQVAAGHATAPRALVLLAPLLATASVLLGGSSAARQVRRRSRQHPPFRLAQVVRYAPPVVVLVAAAALSVLVLPRRPVGDDTIVLASALTLDLAVVAPGMAFVLLARARRDLLLALLPMVVIGYAVAALTIPAGQQRLLDAMRPFLVSAELVVVGYLAVLAHRASRQEGGTEDDFTTRFRAAAHRALGNRRVADILTTEVAILYFAIRPWRSPPLQPGTHSVHRRVGYSGTVLVLLFAVIVETVAVHLLLRQWSALAAWILTGASLYGCAWMVGDYRALVARPLRVTATHLLFCIGVRWEARIPRATIAAAEPMAPSREPPRPDVLHAALLGQANVRLVLDSPVEVVGLYGIRRRVTEIRLTVDEPSALCQQLRGGSAR